MSEAIGREGAVDRPQIAQERRTGPPEGNADSPGAQRGTEGVEWVEAILGYDLTPVQRRILLGAIHGERERVEIAGRAAWNSWRRWIIEQWRLIDGTMRAMAPHHPGAYRIVHGRRHPRITRMHAAYNARRRKRA